MSEIEPERTDIQKIGDSLDSINDAVHDIAEQLCRLADILENLTFSMQSHANPDAIALRISDIGD